VSAAGELVSIVLANTESTAEELALFPEMVRLLKQVANGEVDGRAEAVGILARMHPRVGTRPGAPKPPAGEARGVVQGRQSRRTNRAHGEIFAVTNVIDRTTPHGMVVIAGSTGPVPAARASDDETTEEMRTGE
jgi:hypothetical protein